jgi:hypothetical protein
MMASAMALAKATTAIRAHPAFRERRTNPTKANPASALPSAGRVFLCSARQNQGDEWNV